MKKENDDNDDDEDNMMWKKERKKLCCGSTALAWWEALRRGGTPAPSMWFIALTSVTICFLFLFFTFCLLLYPGNPSNDILHFVSMKQIFLQIVVPDVFFVNFGNGKLVFLIQRFANKFSVAKICKKDWSGKTVFANSQNYQQLGQRHPSWCGISPKNTFLLEGFSLSLWFLTKQSEHWY